MAVRGAAVIAVNGMVGLTPHDKDLAVGVCADTGDAAFVRVVISVEDARHLHQWLSGWLARQGGPGGAASTPYVAVAGGGGGGVGGQAYTSPPHGAGGSCQV